MSVIDADFLNEAEKEPHELLNESRAVREFFGEDACVRLIWFLRRKSERLFELEELVALPSSTVRKHLENMSDEGTVAFEKDAKNPLCYLTAKGRRQFAAFLKYLHLIDTAVEKKLKNA